MDATGKVDRAFKFLKVARAREAYEARRERGGTVADLEALAASGFRAGVIYPDPPWRYLTFGPGGKLHTSAANHFEEMTIDKSAPWGRWCKAWPPTIACCACGEPGLAAAQ